jgi:tRNA wybutosine-synthesizing protein 3
MTFELNKKNILGKIDKSQKGEIDQDIQELVYLINSRDEYYTTSSCAGRIVVIEMPESGRKDEAEWLLVKHGSVTVEEIKDSLKSEEDVWLKEEGMILHVCCKTIENAEKLVNLAKNSGFKRTGMITVNKRYIVEIVSTENVSTILAKKGKILVDDSYLSVLVDECNYKLSKNKQKIDKFIYSFKNC